jgi:hypothetical protein
MNRAARSDASQAAEVAGAEPVGFESGPRAKPEFVAKALGRIGVRGVVHRIAVPQVAPDPETLQQRNQVTNGFMTDLPDAAACARTIAVRELDELQIRLLQEQRGAGRGAASPCHSRFKHGRRDAGGCESMGDQGTGHSGAHDGDARFVMADERWIPLLDRGMTKPYWTPES